MWKIDPENHDLVYLSIVSTYFTYVGILHMNYSCGISTNLLAYLTNVTNLYSLYCGRYSPIYLVNNCECYRTADSR